MFRSTKLCKFLVASVLLLLSVDVHKTMSVYHMEYLLSMLGKFQKFSFILHFDVPNAHLGNSLLRNLSASKPTFISSYNASDASYIGLHRPAGTQFVHLILLEDPAIFRHHLAVYGNVILYHSVVFIVQDIGNLASRFWQLEYLKFAGRVLIVNITSPEAVYVHRKCYYCGAYARALEALDFKRNDSTINATVSEVDAALILPSNFLRLHGQYLRIAHNEYFPYIYCRGRYLNHSHCDNLAGTEWKLLEVLSQKLNFTFSTVGGEYDVFAHLTNDTADVVIGGVILTYMRFISVTFSKFIRYEDLSFLYVCRISLWHYLKLYSMPFKSLVWVGTFGVFVAISFVFKFAVRLPTVGFRASLLMCLQLLVEQTNAKISGRLLGRYYSPFILLALLFITCTVLSTSYKSMLSSILIRPPHREPHNGEELVSNGFRLVINPKQVHVFTGMFSESDKFLLEYVKRLGIPVDGLCNQLQYIAGMHGAVMDEKSILQYKTVHKCIDLMRTREDISDGDAGLGGSYNPDKLRITIEPIRSAPHAWALTPATPFWKAIDIMIGYLQNGGFLDKWTKDALLEIGNKKIVHSKDNMVERKQSDLVTYGCSFLLYIIGNIIAGAVFCIELLAQKYHNQNFAFGTN